MKILILLISYFLLLHLYACNENPTASPNTDSISDIDGHTYKTVKIGSQWWMAENLKVTRFRNGGSIANITGSLSWTGLSTPAYCTYINDDENSEIYGLLYNWFAVNDNRNMAPQAWHIATDDDWNELEIFLGMSQAEVDRIGWRGLNEGSELKSTETSLWNNSNSPADDTFGFSALAGGHRYVAGIFEELGLFGYWWTATEFAEPTSFARILRHNGSDISRFDDYKQ